MSNPVFLLPAYTVGPYTLKVTPIPRHAFSDKRRIVEHDWNLCAVHIAEDLNSRRATECLFRSLVTAIHYRSGLNDRSNEESFTHSLATGLVELAQNNPAFWRAFNEHLEQEYAPGAGWGRLAAGDRAVVAIRPTSIVYDGQPCSVSWIPDAEWTDPNAYGFYWLKQHRIDLNADLTGNNLALVTLHEVLHFLHERLGLKDSTKERDFKRGQAALLPRFIQQNPQFWAWWVQTVAYSQLARPTSPSARRKTA